ncbi:hypothetical protein YPPY36_2022, partial [Yersinia pestis PY-36]
MSVGNPA